MEVEKPYCDSTNTRNLSNSREQLTSELFSVGTFSVISYPARERISKSYRILLIRSLLFIYNENEFSAASYNLRRWRIIVQKVRLDVRNRNVTAPLSSFVRRKEIVSWSLQLSESSRSYFLSRSRCLRSERNNVTTEGTMRLGANLHDEPLAFGTNVLSRWKA